MFLLKGGCAVFVFATETTAVLATWGSYFSQPNQSRKHAIRLNYKPPEPFQADVCEPDTWGEFASILVYGAGLGWPIAGVVSGESTGEESHVSCSYDSEMQPRGYLLDPWVPQVLWWLLLSPS